MKELKIIMGKYWKMHFNRNKWNINRNFNLKTFGSMYFFHLSSWIVSYEDIGIIDSKVNGYFRVLQNEWEYEHIEEAMVLLNDWVNISPMDPLNHDQIRNRAKLLNDEYRNNASYNTAHKTLVKTTTEFKEFLSMKYDKCNQALLKLLQRYPGILLGEWIAW